MNAWHVSSVLAYHLPRSPVAPGHGFEPRVTALETVSLTIGNPGVKMEESGGIEPRWLSTGPRLSGALGDHSPALSLEHPAAVETANTEIRTRNILILSQADLPVFLAGQNQECGLGLIATESG